jgi:GAF domain-containing protein
LVQVRSATNRPSFADDQAALRREASLRRIATLVAQGVQPLEIFSAVSEEVGWVFGSQYAGVGRFEPDGSAVVIVGVSEGIRNIPIGTRWPLEDFLAVAAVYRTGRPARNDKSDWENAPGPIANSLRELGIVSTVAAPIVVEGNVWGAITVSDTHQRLPPDAEERLAAFTELVATAIANAESRGELAASEARARELADEQAALRRVATLVAQGASPDELFAAVAEEVAGVIGVPVVGLHRYEADATFTVLGMAGDTNFNVGGRCRVKDEGIAGMILATGRPARKNDYSGMPGPSGAAVRTDQPVTLVGVPIVVDGSIWGFLVAGGRPGNTLPADTEERLARFTELVSTAIANSQAREHLAQLADEQAALRRVAALVAGGASSIAVFDAVAQEVAQLVQFTPTLVARYEDDGATLTVLAICGARPASFAPGSRWPLDGPTVAAEVLRTGRPVRLEDYTDIPGTLAHEAREHGWTRTAGAPIIVDGRVWGLIAASGPPDERLPENLEDRLAEFTQLVATAIANSQAHDELAQLADEQAALRRVATLVAEGAATGELFAAVADEVAAVVGVSSASVSRFLPDDSSVVLASLNDPGFPIGSQWRPDEGTLNAKILETGQPVRIDQKAMSGPIAEASRVSDVRSVVGAPIVVEGSVWGMVAVGRQHSDDPLPADTEVRLTDFTELIATAISNAEARDGERRLTEEQAALRRVATLVAEGATPNQVFDAVREEVARMFDIPRTILMRFDADGMATLLATYGDYLGPVGTRWPLEGDSSAVARVHQTRRAARADYTYPRHVRGPLAEAARRGGVRYPVAVPVVVEGALWGAMSAGSYGPEPPPADLEGRLAKFTELLGTAIANAESRAEVDASRARIVATADATRRRIERDLHDGIQQWLVALALKARKAATFGPTDTSAQEELSDIADDLGSVLDELREISRGIHPAILSDAGLDDALKALARRSPIRVALEVDFEGRYDPSVEATVYYVVAESITNAVKHAHASVVAVRGAVRDGAIELEIRDDGVGGAEPSRGSGITGLKDRVDTLGGTFSFSSPAGAGTTIRMRLPVGPPDERDRLLGSEDAGSVPSDTG